MTHSPVEMPNECSQGLVVEARQALDELLVPLQALGLRGDFWREETKSRTVAESIRHRLAPGLPPGPCAEGRWSQGFLADGSVWEQVG